MSALDFVHGLTIDASHGPSRTVATGFNGDAAVVDGAVITFSGSVKKQFREDVLHSTLFAQLIANARFDRTNNYEGWYRQYQEVLQSLGWFFSTPLRLTGQPAANRFPSVDKLVMQRAAPVLSGDELQKLVATIEALQSANQSVVVLDQEVMQQSSNKANFQIGVASERSRGITLKLGAYYYQTESGDIRSRGGVMFFRLLGDPSVEFVAGDAEMILNTDIYRTVRQSVIDKLGQKIETFIRPFDV